MRLHDFFGDKIDEHIVKVKGGYRLVSKHGGKNLGTYPTRAGAEKRERQVQYFKHAGESVEESLAIAKRMIAEGQISGFRPPFTVAGNWINDSRGRGVCEMGESRAALKDIADALNAWVQQGVAEGFKNEYSVGDRVDTPMGSATIVALSPNINQDGKIRVKLDDPSRAGEDGKHKDTFTITTNMCKHISESDISGLLDASKLNKSFIITAKTAEGPTKQYRVKAQSDRVAREKFARHYSMAKILDVKEEA